MLGTRAQGEQLQKPFQAQEVKYELKAQIRICSSYYEKQQ